MPDVSQNIIAAMYVLHKEGLVTSLDDVLKFVPVRAVAEILSMSNERFKKKVAAPKTFTDLEVQKLADAFGMEWRQVKRMLVPISQDEHSPADE
jgi:hypothetical protein